MAGIRSAQTNGDVAYNIFEVRRSATSHAVNIGNHDSIPDPVRYAVDCVRCYLGVPKRSQRAKMFALTRSLRETTRDDYHVARD